jgi:hypothetical protein
MSPKKLTLPGQRIDNLIREIRGRKVILDSDLARVYGVLTKAFNQAVKRNLARFPEDLIFRLSKGEAEAWPDPFCLSVDRSGGGWFEVSL